MRKILHSVATAGEIQGQHSFKLVSDFVTIDNTLTVRKIAKVYLSLNVNRCLLSFFEGRKSPVTY